MEHVRRALDVYERTYGAQPEDIQDIDAMDAGKEQKPKPQVRVLGQTLAQQTKHLAELQTHLDDLKVELASLEGKHRYDDIDYVNWETDVEPGLEAKSKKRKEIEALTTA